MSQAKLETKDHPWMMRTYAGHSNARKSNELYRNNLAKGQTGLSIAFDLPTQTGYDSDHPRALGEVGKVGVPVSHMGDLENLLANIPLDKMNTSMTINSTAMWLLALYTAVAKRQGITGSQLKGTTQNDILKEFLARGTYIFPPEPSIRLITDMCTDLVDRCPSWNPINICSYHLQEAGATPAQEIAFAFANACEILDRIHQTEDLPAEQFEKIVGRFSFFVNAGIRFVEELCKMRAFSEIWEEITSSRYGVTHPKFRRFRYGVQVNSLGLTAQQPENNIQRIVLEMLAVTLSRSGRARAIQLPAWNEALGLPRPWDQQWSLRLQQVLALETDLLEYPDIFDGSTVIATKVAELKTEARGILDHILDEGGAAANVDWMKRELVSSHVKRVQAIEAGTISVVGVNCFTESEESPLLTGQKEATMTVAEEDVREQLTRLAAHRMQRNDEDVQATLRLIRTQAQNGENLMEISISAAEVGVTTGEWADTLRAVFGEYRAPTGIDIRTPRVQSKKRETVRLRSEALRKKLGRPLRILIGKPGLDGHSNGAEQIAVRARDLGFEVIYGGIRLAPEEIVNTAIEEGVDVVGLSILSGSHMTILPEIARALADEEDEVPVLVAGGMIPETDRQKLLHHGYDAIFTPKDFDLDDIFDQILTLVETHQPG